VGKTREPLEVTGEIKMTEEEKRVFLVTRLADRIRNLEYQLKNKAFLTKAEIADATKNLEADRDSAMQLILWKAKEMGYPPMNEWSDTEPMSVIDRMASGRLTGTDFFQEVLFKIIMS
jgi:hypothetical protein